MNNPARLILPLVLIAGLSACASAPPREGAVAQPRTPLEQFQAPVTAQADEVRLAIHAQGISGPQADALVSLVHAWRTHDGGPIRLQSPVGVADSGAAYRMGESVRAFLVSQGVPHTDIQLLGYEAQGAAGAPMVVGYDRYVAQVPRCGQSWENLTSTGANRTSANFGCSVTANLAAQIANPADLVRPRDMDPSDAARRMEVLDNYRRGEPTSTQADDQARGALSQAVR